MNSASLEVRLALGVKGLDAFDEIVGAAQPAIGLAFELDSERQARILAIVHSFLALRCASGAKLHNSSTSASVIFSSSASATHSVAIPHSNARNPVIRRERMTMSLARVTPTIFCSRAAPPEPGIMPSRCSGKA